MQKIFEIARGSIPGANHLQRGNLLIGRNNQDACASHQDDEITVAIVADGCGGQDRSEVGANLGAQLMVKALERQYYRYKSLAAQKGFSTVLPTMLEAARQDVIALLRIVATTLAGDGSFSAAINDNFLFTLVGVLVTPMGAAFFSIGDGLFAVNGKVTRIGPFKNNEPPYIAYALYASRWTDEELRFVVNQLTDVEELDNFLVGTDGVGDLCLASERTIPGAIELIGPLEQFWSTDAYFSKSGIRRFLARVNSTHSKAVNGQLVVDVPRLPDDTTLIVGRRKQQI